MPVGPDALWTAVLDHLQRDGRVARNGPWLHLPAHTSTLADAEHCGVQARRLRRQVRRDPRQRPHLAPVIEEVLHHLRHVAAAQQLA
ncbi:hypothetical protein G6F32_015653 [Rhizopus arrhizus]|nr:hypothetical protein G6F32_015653 [Rhizopus arrhizus]